MLGVGCKPVHGCRAAAEAWEAAFVELARTQLGAMAAAAGLRLSFSSERSVADELARESYADVSTVCIAFSACILFLGSSSEREIHYCLTTSGHS